LKRTETEQIKLYWKSNRGQKKDILWSWVFNPWPQLCEFAGVQLSREWLANFCYSQ